ncbi:hypothetical protein EST38_g8752 [Candolleomyces aberdarensis]|uniref:Nephrocystin 3-like N-terminal domain-containing protein n=1 Tax=Candolleomyces aberdarensis TaxID=2316362 RepID=A0A4V1Q324_9AGAR|nr:hypothetical protein EST38_g8752 [Candolleomyces aberdarensis]
MASSLFSAHHFNIEYGSFVTAQNYFRSTSSADPSPLRELQSRIAVGAMHDSAERCDAPKCHPETRIAVQDELYGWILEGDLDAKPKKMKWVTGPAGTGKTAIMGTLTDTCCKEGHLGASFFFSSSSASAGCRTKVCFVPTLAYQLARTHDGLKEAILDAVEHNPEVFEKNLHVQMETLVLNPLRQVGTQGQDPAIQPQAVIVDGLDECGASESFRWEGRSWESTIPSQERSKEDDQLEILQVLQHATMDPAFPFRVIIASRPERVFRLFFNTTGSDVQIASILTLDERYHPDADITLYLEATFSEIRRRWKLSPAWPAPNVVATLVKKASGQFIYAATIIRFLTQARTGNPHALLDIVLNIKPKNADINPFAHLHALYFHVLNSSPDPTLSVGWLWIINGLIPFRHSTVGRALRNIYLDGVRPPAYFVNAWLQTFEGEGERLLGDLHSLVKIRASRNPSLLIMIRRACSDIIYKSWFRRRCQQTFLRSSILPLHPLSNGLLIFSVVGGDPANQAAKCGDG